MKRTICILTCCMLILGMTACGKGSESGPEEPPRATAEAVTFTDDLGRQVTVNHPQRVAALIGSFADIWCLSGGKETLVAAADDTWTSFDLGLDESVANLGGVKNTNLETLLASQPDFVLASSNTSANVDLLETLEKSGITTAYFKVSTFDDYLSMLKICTQITGCSENYTEYGTWVQDQVDVAKAHVSGTAPTVLYLRATGASCKVKNSRDSVLGEMLADLGCVNIADSRTSLLENLNMEAIIDANPDYIFVVLQGVDPTMAQKTLENAVLSNPAWNHLPAVQNGRCYTLDSQLYNLKPNARWGEAYEKLANILYPQG